MVSNKMKKMCIQFSWYSLLFYFIYSIIYTIFSMFLFWFMQKLVGSLLCVYCVFAKSTNSNDLV